MLLEALDVCSISRLHIKNPVTVFSRIAGPKACSFVGSARLGRTAPASLGRYSCSLSDPHRPDCWASVSFPWLLFLTCIWNCKYFLYAYPYEVKMNGRLRGSSVLEKMGETMFSCPSEDNSYSFNTHTRV